MISLLAPGLPMWRRRRTLAVVCLLIGSVAPLAVLAYTVVSGRNWVALSLDTDYLGWLMAALVGAVAARIGAIAELWLARGAPRRPAGPDWAAVGGATAVLVLLVVGIVQVGRARASIAPAFVEVSEGALFDASQPDADPSAGGSVDDAPSSGDLPRSTTTTTPAEPVPVDGGAAGDGTDSIPDTQRASTTTTLPPLPERPRSGIDPAELADVHTVLLLGGDAGPGRYGLRTDTMMLFSLHEPSGRAALISIPRDMKRLLFPPDSALGQRFPYGYSDLSNSVYPYVNSRAAMRDSYRISGVSPGVVALAHGLGYSLDITIHDYVMIDMQGFIDLVDAVGGVTVYVSKELPMPGNVPGARTQYPDTIGPGRVAMDGTVALGYVRSRAADNDYYRVARQRSLLAALATQIAPEDVLISFNAVTDALGSALRTSLTPDQLAETLNVIGGETAIVESIGLVPPLISIERPNFQLLADVVGDIQMALVTGVPSGR